MFTLLLVLFFFLVGGILIFVICPIEVGSLIEHNPDQLGIIESLQALLQGLDRRDPFPYHQERPIYQSRPQIGIGGRRHRC